MCVHLTNYFALLVSGLEGFHYINLAEDDPTEEYPAHSLKVTYNIIVVTPLYNTSLKRQLFFILFYALKYVSTPH